MSTPHIRDYPGGRIHMIGIGGSSMSGLAEMLLDQGYQVTGSDRDETYLVHFAREKGAEVMIGHKAENVHGADLVVYSAAISPENPERIEADRLGIPSIERAWLLGQLMEGYQKAVGVCGAHGKTTVTSMLSQMTLENGFDPGIHIGGRLDAIGGSTRVGHGDLFIAEACEYNRSFLHMPPTIAVVLNIDADHLDCYRDIDEIEETFGQYLAMLPENGTAVGNGDDPRIMRLFRKLTCKKTTFGFGKENDWYPENLREDDRGYATFDLTYRGEKKAEIRMGVPGDFNVLNALAAIAAAAEIGLAPEKAAETVERFVGAHRRFELTDKYGGIEFFHDYGHNPAEMRNALSIARKRCKGRLWAVMQPHTFSRVRTLFDQYLTCTEEADYTLVTDICAAREKDPGDLNSGMLVEGMKQNGIDAIWTPSFDDTEEYLKSHCRPGDLVLTMGCGDINLLNDQIHRHILEKQIPLNPRNRRIVDVARIEQNMKAICSALPEKVKALAVVKADGYGHGAVRTARAAIAGGASMLAVASVEEGAALRNAGIRVPVLVLGAVTGYDVQKGIEHDLIQTVCSPKMVEMCEAAAEELQKQTEVHLKIDTGMGRIGVRTKAERDEVLQALGNCSHVRLSGAFTHFSDADDGEDGEIYTAQQFERFLEMTEGLPEGVIRHCCNSAAIHRHPEMYLDMVRAGISLYGYPPVRTDLPLKPCMRWTATISYIKEIPAGTYVSYGRTWQANQPGRVATVTCGYGDGYHRCASGKAMVLIHGKKARVLGRICMDQMVADVTEIPEARTGDEVVLIGRDGNEQITAEDLAEWSGTISYVILLSVGSRVEREIIDSGRKGADGR